MHGYYSLEYPQIYSYPASCVTSTGMPAQNAATIIKPLVPNLHSTLFTHGIYTWYTWYVADWVAPFPSSSPQIPPYPLFRSPLPPFRAGELVAIINT